MEKIEISPATAITTTPNSDKKDELIEEEKIDTIAKQEDESILSQKSANSNIFEK